MKLGKKILFGLIGSTSAVLAWPVFTLAATCGGTETSVIGCSQSDGSVVWGLLEITLNVLAGLVGVAAVGGFVYGALLYSSAGDKAAQVTKAKTTITNVVVGLVLFVGMYSFLQFLIPGGVFGKSVTTPTATHTPNNESSDENNESNGNSGKKTDKKAFVRLGVYNAKSVNETSASQLERFKVGWSKIKDAADIIVIAEFSPTHYTYLSGNPKWTAYYPPSARGERGLAILYRNDILSASGRGSVTIPLISTTGEHTSRIEPTITLTRKKDGAKLSIMAVHLAAINNNRERWKTNQQRQQPVIGKWLANHGEETRVAAGDFNWYIPGATANLTGTKTKLRGERVMRVMIPSSQKFGNHYRIISGNGFSDHPQIITDIETSWFK